MGICGSKESSADSPYVEGTTRQQQLQQRQSKGGGLKDDSAIQKQTPPGNNAAGSSKGNTKGSTSGSRHSESNDTVINKIEKAGSIQTQTTASRVSNNDEKATNSSNKDKEVKVLLLGAGESGKSTIIQQLKILHQNGFNHEELLEYRPVVFKNVLEIGKELLDARAKFELVLDDEADVTEDDIREVYSFDQSQENQDNKETTVEQSEEKSKDLQNYPSLSTLTQFPPNVSRTLSKVWNLASTKDLINGSHRSKFYLMDSAQYFLDNLARISELNYIPNEQDILRSRQKTSGIFDSVFDVGSNLKLHMYDVGGQRSERKKWIHCFDNVTLIIFCVSLSEYDQSLLEDQSQNRFQESLVLFDNVINSRWFSRTSVVLCLNKIDLFAEKLQKVPLENYFPDYTGGKDINKAAKYILWRFVQLNRANLSIYPHVTQATDTSNIKLVFAAIKETLLENSLKDTGVL